MSQAWLQESMRLLEPELVDVSDKYLHLTEKGEGTSRFEDISKHTMRTNPKAGKK